MVSTVISLGFTKVYQWIAKRHDLVIYDYIL